MCIPVQYGRNLARRGVIIHRGAPSDTTQEIEEHSEEKERAQKFSHRF